MTNNLPEFFNDIPEIISSSIQMVLPNKSITIYKGAFVLKHNK